MKTLSIGRNQECDIYFDEPSVSRRHALLRIHPFGKYDIISNGTNGTKVNGNEIASNAPYPLKRGDSVVFASAARLDWDKVPNPLKPFKITIICIISAICVALATWGVITLINTFKVGSTEEVTEVKADDQAEDKDAEKTDTVKTETPVDATPKKDFLHEDTNTGKKAESQKPSADKDKTRKRTQEAKKPVETQPEEPETIELY